MLFCPFSFSSQVLPATCRKSQILAVVGVVSFNTCSLQKQAPAAVWDGISTEICVDSVPVGYRDENGFQVPGFLRGSVKLPD